MNVVVSVAIAVESRDASVGEPDVVVGLHPRRNLTVENKTVELYTSSASSQPSTQALTAVGAIVLAW